MSTREQLMSMKAGETKYLVWIGGTPNEFDNIQDAIIEQKEWTEKGYDDVVIESVIKNQ